ncbi:phospholipase A2-like [Choristoneura fumiferana]|uniref:phospholipase A2-like n=1 Tax=Choristoneura fumiferana TaxID=7141 RepID=UPI003D159C9C
MCFVKFVLVLIVNVFVLSGGWVINEVDFPSLQGKGLDPEDGNDVEEFNELRFSLIYPGTKWCGAGNVADSYDDLGSSRETDKCCRAHDFCPDVISAGETKYGLTNSAFYSRLSCECDEEFRRCLRTASTKTAKQIGTIYFNALRTQCFREDYPVVGCTRRGGWLNSKCLEPEFDKSGARVFQWFDVPNY